MAYTFYYDYTTNPEPDSSRSVAYVFGGAVCPTSASFGYVHGPTPARGKITFKGAFVAPIAQPVLLTIGFSTYYGICIKGEISQSAQDGNLTTFDLVDYRDNLLDVQMVGMFNMTDPEGGTWYHMLPVDWYNQLPLYIKQLETPEDMSEDQDIQDLDFNGAQGCLPPFSAATILNGLAKMWGFTVTSSSIAFAELLSNYPDNLDWNNGRSVGGCIQDICDKCNLQFTVFGNLIVYVTKPGSPDGFIEQGFMSGTIDLCQFLNYTESSLGSEMNDKGRRVIVLGDRNKHENWYPCVPDWPKAWTYNLCSEIGAALSMVLQANDLTQLDLLEDMPSKYVDYGKWNGKPRNKLTIQEYLEQIPFKAYRVDFSTPLSGTPPIISALSPVEVTAEDTDEAEGDPDAKPKLQDEEGEDFNPAAYDITNAEDSAYPVSDTLCSDIDKQFVAVATSRKLYKGLDAVESLLKGQCSIIDDGVSLDIQEDILSNTVSTGKITGNECRKTYRVLVVFNEARFIYKPDTAAADDEETDDKTGDQIEAVPEDDYFADQVYVRLSIDVERYFWAMGDPVFVNGSVNPRVRETMYPMQGLRKTYIDFQESPMIAQNYLGQGFVNDIFPDQIAQIAAIRFLNHEFMTTAGFVTFMWSAGFMPSGIIESVNVVFSAETGVRETINFTNLFNDSRVPNFFPIRTRKFGTTATKGETAGKEYNERQEARKALKTFKAIGQATDKQPNNQQANIENASQKFGDAQTAMMKFNISDIDGGNSEGRIEIGEVLLVEAADNDNTAGDVFDDGSIEVHTAPDPFGIA